jgi:hypothetical protein
MLGPFILLSFNYFSNTFFGILGIESSLFTKFLSQLHKLFENPSGLGKEDST